MTTPSIGAGHQDTAKLGRPEVEGHAPPGVALAPEVQQRGDRGLVGHEVGQRDAPALGELREGRGQAPEYIMKRALITSAVATTTNHGAPSSMRSIDGQLRGAGDDEERGQDTGEVVHRRCHDGHAIGEPEREDADRQRQDGRAHRRASTRRTEPGCRVGRRCA